SSRLLHLIALLCVAAVGAAMVFHQLFDMPPYAWCVLQGLLLFLIALISWAGLLVGRRLPAVPRVAGALGGLVALEGIASGWYEYTVAAEMFSCDRTFADHFMVNSGLDAGIPWLFGIFATCMDARVE